MALEAHCGIAWAYFDGRYWVPSVPVDVPSDWGDVGIDEMILVAPDSALFVAGTAEVGFRPAPADYRPPPCF